MSVLKLLLDNQKMITAADMDGLTHGEITTENKPRAAN